MYGKILKMLGCGISLGLSVATWAGEAPRALTTEWMHDPDGLDNAHPRLGWKLPEDFSGQSAYEIDAGVWRSGKIASDAQQNLPWAGPELASSQRVTWRVRVWDRADRVSDWSAPATFMMGVLKPTDWKAQWIGPAPETRPDEDLAGAQWITTTPGTNGTVVLRRTFRFDGCTEGQFVELVHAAYPQHTIRINGTVAHQYAGMVHRWNFLRFRDITSYLKKGENTLEVTVDAPTDKTAPSAFLAKLTFPEGTRLVTDASWEGADGVRTLGGVHDPEFARPLVLRTETESPAFAKAFAVTRPVKEATLHITGLGFYEASLNGRRIGSRLLDPSPTCYDRHVLYSTYRLDDLIQPGTNRLEVLVGHGWYDVRSIAVWDWATAPWRDFPRMLAQLELTYTDGAREIVASDATWQQVTSPVAFDCIREGEVIDRTRQLAAPRAAAVVPAPAGKLVASAIPPTKVQAEYAPESIREIGPGAYHVKFPVNLAGWVRLEVAGQRRGDVVSIRYDERPDGARAIDQHFRYTASHRACATRAGFQTDRLVCTGAPVETYEPRFTYNGFQYVTLHGLREPPKAIVARFIHTDFAETAACTSSDPTLDTLMTMAVRSYKSNFTDGYPTDCPHREKNGWTGDASVASELAQYLFENTAAYEKWLRDLCDTQLTDGNLCCLAPTAGWGYAWGNGPAWDSALPVVAWNLYCYRDDRRVVEAVYPALVRYLAYTRGRESSEGLVAHGLGDWNAVNWDHMPTTEYTSSCYYLQAQAIAAEMARVLGRSEEAQSYDAGVARTRRAIRAKYRKADGVYDNGGQTAQAFALAFGLVTPAETDAVARQLVAAFARTGNHLDVGLLGTKFVFRALSRVGRTDLAYRVLTQPTGPSMTDWMRKGGTCLWEDWDDGASRNHIMFGDFAGWVYSDLAGIRLPEAEGSCPAVPRVTARAFREIVLAPQAIAELDRLSATVETPYGPVTSGWTRTDGRTQYAFRIPPGITATVRIPGRPDERIVGPARLTRE